MRVEYFIILLNFINGAFGGCVWYGQCVFSPKIKNCLDRGEPRPFAPNDKDVAMGILRKRCPFLLQKYPGDKFCCDLKMLKSMEMGLILAEMAFKRCPTCISNWFQHVCEFNCSPHQDKFMNPKVTDFNDQNKEYIVEIDIYLTERYKVASFNACKDVVMPSTGMRAITHACRNDRYCTPRKWFESMGDATQAVVPFQINYVQPTNASYTSLDLPTLPCNESFEGGTACSCADCEASCVIPFEDPTGGTGGCPMVFDFFTYFIMFLGVAFLLSAVFFFGAVWRNRKNGNTTIFERHGDRIHSYFEDFFTKLGLVCARHPAKIIAVSCVAILALVCGGIFLKVSTEPVEIWADPGSRCRTEKDYFDSKFGPFYRTSQIFIQAKNLSSFAWKDDAKGTTHTLGPIFREEFLRAVYDLQMDIQQLTTEGGYGLKDICYAPMRTEYTKNHTVSECIVQSVWGYMKNDVTILERPDEFPKKLAECLSDNFNVECFAPYGGPIFSELAVTGFEDVTIEMDGMNYTESDYKSATGVLLTFLVNNRLNKTELGPALAWEEKFINYLKNWTEMGKPCFLDVAFSAERSVQDEIERESEAEIGTMVFSYLVMFIYIAITLGKFRRISTILVDSRIMLGVGGIAIVVASVLSSLGFFGYLGVPTTLLTIEVIPFLVLAVGVDNIFILVHAVQHLKRRPEETVEELIGRALGEIGPSILLTGLSEASCFLIGSLSNMPAVQTFALYSSVAIIFNFLLQVTIFVSCLSLDFRRMQDGRLDIFCCLKAAKKDGGCGARSEILYNFFRNHYGPFLMRRNVRITVIAVFCVWLIASAYLATEIELGLDQELSVPEDSYLVNYFRNLRDLMSTGPPVYFVVKRGLNYTNSHHINSLCGTIGCNSDSLVTYLTRASALENVTYLVKSPSSWIDDYFGYAGSSSCCMKFQNGSYCPQEFRETSCMDCDIKLDGLLRPSMEDFDKYLPFFLADVPNEECPKAGRASYSGAITFEEKNGKRRVADSYFMGYHTVLRTSKDYYTALDRSRNIAAHISKSLTKDLGFPVDVFSYSVFYVFYEQYLTLVNDAVSFLLLSLFTVFVVTFIFTGLDYVSSCLVLITVSSILVDMMGMMHVWGITFNAISLVNLIVSVGIGVEFCSHLVHNFATSVGKDKATRALRAISDIGSSIFSGITLTKFSGILVLAFAKSLIFRIFYFRMYLGMVLIGAAHGLVLLPVLLSYFGPRLNAVRMERLARRDADM